MLLRLSKQPTFNTSYGLVQQVLETANETPSIRSISNAIIKIRKEKLPDPKEIGNAGSFFKNPLVSTTKLTNLKKQYPQMPFYPVDSNTTKLAAGWLIDQLGWKGYRKGDAGVHQNQALVLVNYNNAQGIDLWDLAQKIQASVLEKYGIALEAEVNIL